MKYIKNTLNFKIEEPTVVTLGKFDGLHRGHEKLMQALLECGNQNHYRTVAFTFDIPPRNVVLDVQSKVLTTNEEKEYIFATTGLDYLIECPFTPEVMNMEPVAFIEWIVRSLHMKCVVVGDDFHFGHKRAGNYETLRQYEKQFGYRTIVVAKVKDGERDISSTYVREEIGKGNLEKGNALLGYPYFIRNEIVHGNRIGHSIGIPTINMSVSDIKLLPPNGVYVTWVHLNGKTYQGVTNIGCKPTVSNENQIGVETHILDFDGDLYGECAVVAFLAYLRPEKRFASVEELQLQMREDIGLARKCYENIT